MHDSTNLTSSLKKGRGFFTLGFLGMLPVTTGAIPFGAVVGTLCHEAGLSFFQTMSMNVVVYAGAAQLASVELMSQHAAALVVIVSGLIINLRFLLYSAAMSPYLQTSGFLIKLAAAYSLTDQSYAVMVGNQDKLKTPLDHLQFYFGTCVCMMLAWHLSVMGGYIFGNFAPAEWALDYAVPLSFVALIIPTLKNKKYVYVAAFSSVVSILLNAIPFKIGLVVTALLSIGFAMSLTRKKGIAT